MSSNIIILIALISAVSLLVLINSLERRRRLDRVKLDKVKYSQQWLQILSYLKSKHGYNLAVIEADKLLDQAFKECQLKGQTMGERLTTAGSQLSNKDAVWRAHKLRNRLVHETDIHLSLKQSQRALRDFKQALKDLGALPK